MSEGTENTATNVEFLGDQAREAFEQDLATVRALDTKAMGLVAASLALLAAGLNFSTKFADLRGGHDAKILWAVTFVAGAVLLLIAGALAASAIMPRGFRIFHVDEIKGWLTPAVMLREPIAVRGRILYGHYLAIEQTRRVIKIKARRLARATQAFALALLCMVFCGLSVAVHGAVYSRVHGSGRFSNASLGHGHGRRIPGGRIVRGHSGRRSGVARYAHANVRAAEDGRISARGSVARGTSRGGRR